MIIIIIIIFNLSISLFLAVVHLRLLCGLSLLEANGDYSEVPVHGLLIVVASQIHKDRK